MSYTVACASSSIAIGEAFRRVRSGEAPIMLTGGSDVPQAYGVARAWEALRVLASGDETTSATACRPFSADRSGLVLGEGGAALVLEDWEHATARGARIHGEMLGYGTTCDHAHLVRPEVDGQMRALRATLVDAALNPDDVDYINAHGTATVEGDPVEVDAIRAIFGSGRKKPALSGTKSMHGHLLGAAGAMEAIVTILALREQALPPTAHLDRIDPACAGAPAQHPIHLCHGIVADAHGAAAALGQHAQGRADAARVNQRGSCGGWLQHGSSTNTSGTLLIERSARREPRQECIEVAQEIAVRNLRGGVRIHELEPEAGA